MKALGICFLSCLLTQIRKHIREIEYMYWANFLHIYQPPTQKKYWINKIAAESYQKITEGLLKNPNAKVTLNINAILTEHLLDNGWDSIIND